VFQATGITADLEAGGTLDPAVQKSGAAAVIGVLRETGSGAKLDRAERKKVMALAQRREIDARSL
jgi:hypothetical protein